MNKQFDPGDNPDEEYDGGPTFDNGDTEVWYDVSGEQHVDLLEYEGA